MAPAESYRAAISGRRGLVIAVLSLGQILAWGSTYFLPAVLMTPIAAETGWPPAWVVSGLSLGLLVAGLVARPVGRHIDRHGGRPMLLLSIIPFAIGLAGLAVAESLWLHLACWLVLGLGMGSGLYDTAFATLARLYGASARSAITVLTLIVGFTSTIVWPLSAGLEAWLGWRGTCLAYAGLLLGLVGPLYLLAVPRVEPYEPPMAAPAAATPGAGPVAPTGAVFLLLAFALTVTGVIQTVLAVHLVPMLQGRGFELATAVALAALIGPAQVGARILDILVGGQRPLRTFLLSMIAITIGTCLLWSGLPVVALAIVVYAAGSGIKTVAAGTLPLALFGPNGYATVIGRLAMPGMIAQAAAPLIGAALIDRFGADGTLGILTLVAVADVAAAVALWAQVRRRAAMP